MGFLTEDEPPRGLATAVAPGIRRLVAANPSVMTYWGTNTYLIDAPGGVLVLDPGPDDPAHVRHVLDQAGAPVLAILLSHTHHDHLGGLKALRAETGAPAFGWHDPADPAFRPDHPLQDGESAWGWEAIHTPGHASDHLCFAGSGGVLFSADHVMSWSSSVVSPPGGNMAQYFDSLERLLRRDDAVYLPGHGPPLTAPQAFTQSLLDHRKAREAAILRALNSTPQSAKALMEQLYSQIDPTLRRAAERNVVAHLAKLESEGQAVCVEGLWRAA